MHQWKQWITLQPKLSNRKIDYGGIGLQAIENEPRELAVPDGPVERGTRRLALTLGVSTELGHQTEMVASPAENASRSSQSFHRTSAPNISM